MDLTRYSDRLDPATYADDEPVVIFEEGHEADGLYVSERLFWRLVQVGKGYELHHLPLLGGMDPVRLGREQCRTLCDELAFVAERLDDPLAVATAQSVFTFVQTRAQRPGEETFVTFEGN